MKKHVIWAAMLTLQLPHAEAKQDASAAEPAAASSAIRAHLPAAGTPVVRAVAQDGAEARKPAAGGKKNKEAKPPAKSRMAFPVVPQTRMAQPLPGIAGELAGKGSPFRQNVIRVSSERVETVYIASGYPNRIATPFREPKVVGVKEGDDSPVDVTTDGSSVFVLSRSDQPTAIFVKDGGRADGSTVSLLLVPRRLPPQTITLMLDENERRLTGSAAEDGDDRGQSHAYTDQLSSQLKAAALGNTPEGCTMSHLPAATGRLGDVVLAPQKRYSCAETDIFSYKLSNATRTVIELREDMLVGEGVRAVAFFPNVRLYPESETFAYVIADKSAAQPMRQDGSRAQ
jgi:conjugal transfer pilus assembly protein TraK